MCADFLLLLDAVWRGLVKGAEVVEEKEGVEGGIREEKPTGEEEDGVPGSETVPSWLWLRLKVQALPFILLRLPMEFRMTVARLMDISERSRFLTDFRSKLVLIRFCKSEENIPACKERTQQRKTRFTDAKMTKLKPEEKSMKTSLAKMIRSLYGEV